MTLIESICSIQNAYKQQKFSNCNSQPCSDAESASFPFENNYEESVIDSVFWLGFKI